MAQTARCVLCGKLIDREFAYAEIKAGKRRYYCSKEEFDGGIEYIEERKKYENTIENAIKNIMSKDAFDPVFYNTCYNQWLTMVSPETLFHFLTDSAEIEKILIILKDKSFTSAKGELAYLSAVIKNRVIKYVYNEPVSNIGKNVKIPDEYDEYKPRLEPRKNMRRSLVDLEDKL